MTVAGADAGRVLQAFITGTARSFCGGADRLTGFSVFGATLPSTATNSIRDPGMPRHAAVAELMPGNTTRRRS
jgi:hypothetical protein